MGDLCDVCIWIHERGSIERWGRTGQIDRRTRRKDIATVSWQFISDWRSRNAAFRLLYCGVPSSIYRTPSWINLSIWIAIVGAYRARISWITRIAFPLCSSRGPRDSSPLSPHFASQCFTLSVFSHSANHRHTHPRAVPYWITLLHPTSGYPPFARRPASKCSRQF